MAVRFGRKPHDPAALAAAPQHRFSAAAPPPAVLNRQAVNFTPLLYRNDVFPDCSAVALANAARAVSRLNGYGLLIDPAKVPAFYAGSVGIAGDDATIEASDGAVMLDVLHFQQHAGFDVGPQTLVAQYGVLDIASRSSQASAMTRFGASYLGVNLHDRDMQTVGLPWSVVAGRDDGPIAGRHAVIGWDYTGLADTDYVRISGWGFFQNVTWAWLHARLEEAYGVVWRQLARTDGTFYSGVSADGLIAELA